MLNMNLHSLIASLDQHCREALEDAATLCVNRGNHEIGLEDFMEALLEKAPASDLVEQFALNSTKLRELLARRPRGTASGSRPVFSRLLVELLQEAYLLTSLELEQKTISLFILVLALVSNPAKYGILPFFAELGKIPPDTLRGLIEGLADTPAASSPATHAPGPDMLRKYATDFTEEARAGKIDPVFARGPEIRQMVDILSRRRKNNPILVGDPGVGKTAVVEGLALRIVQGLVPDALARTRLVGLDMGRLQAGASVKGEFEKRLKGIIDEIKASPIPTILFIDEAHTLVGSGNAAGSGDGANLLKPALARGELRTIAATTWSEYKKYFEKDAALARRFQLVKLDEPSPEETVTILRGIVPHYEATHGVYIRDDAVLQTAELSSRYITGRMQPDKAIDVLDTACARVRVSLGAKPARLEALEESYASIKREIDALERDCTQGVMPDNSREMTARHAELTGAAVGLSGRIKALTGRWEREKTLVEAILAKRADPKKEAATEDGPEIEEAAKETIDEALERLTRELKEFQAEEPLVFYEVSPGLVTEIVSEWTGIPRSKLSGIASDPAGSLAERLKTRIKGQDHAIETVEKAVLSSRAGLNNPASPTAIFLLVGPSGVGKTETALAVADQLFGGERMLISINMSEFQEKHTISRLIGSPPGYVGYGEGGRLTEAVRRQPYSAILFDEVEKAHPDVLNLFYQLFDKGVLADGEGREIDFRNTMVFLTSNLGADIIAALCEDGSPPDQATLQEAIRPSLSVFFKPALLGRMTIIPYTTIAPDILKDLVSMKLERVGERLRHRHRIPLSWSERVVDSIASSCLAVDTGARNIDHILNASLLPGIATELLGTLARTNGVADISCALNVDLSDAGVFSFTLREKTV